MRKFLNRLRILFSEERYQWHIARIAQQSQWQPTLPAKPITALDVEDNIDLCPTMPFRVMPRAQRNALDLNGNLDLSMPTIPYSVLGIPVDAHGNLYLDAPANTFETEPIERIENDVLRLRSEQ